MRKLAANKFMKTIILKTLIKVYTILKYLLYFYMKDKCLELLI